MLGDRHYFKLHRDDARAGLLVSGPSDDGVTRVPMMILSRRLQDGSGGFVGIIQASIRVGYLQDLLSHVAGGPGRVVTVLLADGGIMLLAPGPAPALPVARATDRTLSGASAGLRSGSFTALSDRDHVERLYAYRTLDNAPLVVAVDTAMADVLADWTTTAWLTGVGAVLLDAAAIGVFLAVRRELRRRWTAERHGQMAERRLRLKIETIEDHAFFSLDRSGRVMTWNSGAQAIMGYAAGEILDRPLDLMLVSPDALQTEPQDTEPRAGEPGAGEPGVGEGRVSEAGPGAVAVSRAVGRWEAETECRRQDGTVFAAVVVVSAILEPDDVPAGYAVVIHDLTGQKRLERRIRMMERMDAIGQVTSGVAHDFNNLLQAQIMSLELLQERMDPSSVERELSDVALNAAEQAARLTDQLLAFSRQQMLRPSRVNLEELLVSVISLAQHTAGPNIHLCPVVARGLPAVLVDPALLQTALLNLIINARDAIDVSGTITLHAYPADAHIDPPAGSLSASGFVVLSVADTGRGMDAQTAERACEPFFTTKGARGSGLGLSMVQGFARQSGGDIRITSMPDRGTSVEIWLPCAPHVAAAADQPSPRPRPRAGHILLVDDAPDVLLVLAAFLRGAGFVVTQAGNATEALWHLRRGIRFSMMVTDFLMPGMDGMELAHQARLSRPDLPVLIISGFAHSERLSDLAPGFALLRKPFRKEDLLASVGGLLPEPPGHVEAVRRAWQERGPDAANRAEPSAANEAGTSGGSSPSS